MCQSKIKRFELVELTIPANSTNRVNFQSIPQLRNQSDQQITIKKIEIYPASVYANSQVTNSIPGMPSTELPKAALVLYVNGEESVRLIPLSRLASVDDNSSPFAWQPFELDDLTNVDFDKSYVQFNAAAAATTYVIPFGISYLRMSK